MPQSAYLLAADAVLVLHAFFVAFVVVGLGLIILGGFLGWSFVRQRLFRWLHLAAIGIVVAQAWLGVRCPLTIAESWLRRRAGDATYEGDFIAHWVSSLLYYDWPGWVFTALYSAFGALVLATWIWLPPHRAHCSARDARQ